MTAFEVHLQITMNLNESLDQLLENDYFIVDGFLPELIADQLREEALELREEDEFRKAKIGKGIQKQRISEVRSDLVHWLNRDEASGAQEHYWQAIDDLRTKLSDFFRIALVRTEMHFALYPKGAFYDRHFDQFQGSSNRIFSVILYLNESWKSGDGGELKIYSKSGEQLIEPLHNRFICFNSEMLEHEVLVCNAPRLSLTGWVRRDEFLF